MKAIRCVAPLSRHQFLPHNFVRVWALATTAFLLTLPTYRRNAADRIALDQADTRALIDQQLRDAGWEADTRVLRYAKGARPVMGRNQAIAEWPTTTGPPDYALFCGMTLVGTIEAKRRNRNVLAVLRQAERFASDTQIQEAEFAEGGPWLVFKAPFAFSTNGRPYLKQVEALSGIWRCNVCDPDNPAEVLAGWPATQADPNLQRS